MLCILLFESGLFLDKRYKTGYVRLIHTRNEYEAVLLDKKGKLIVYLVMQVHGSLILEDISVVDVTVLDVVSFSMSASKYYLAPSDLQLTIGDSQRGSGDNPHS